MPDKGENLEPVMTDGPHRSLPMRPWWKGVAKCAKNPSYGAEDIQEAHIRACEKDWREEMMEMSPNFANAIRKIIEKPLLLPDVAIQSLESLRPLIPGCPIGNTLLDNLTRAAGEGKYGETTLRKALADALTIHSERCERQIEEHCSRESSSMVTQSVCRRMREARQLCDFDSLANQLLDPCSKSSRRVNKRDGLDDGVPL